MLSFELNKIGEIPPVLGRMVRSYRFALAAFLVPVFIRSIPEILVGPYPIGWDTITFYVTNTLDLAAGRAGFLVLLGNAPLLYSLSLAMYTILGLDPILIFKVLGPILYGGMTWSLYRFLRVGLGWSSRESLGAVLFSSLYFVTLRIGWDMYKDLLGLTFVLLSLPLINDHPSLRSKTILSGLIALSVASDQLTGVIALSVVGLRGLLAFFRTSKREFLELVEIGFPGAILFLLIALAGSIVSGTSLIQSNPVFLTPNIVVASVGFVSYAYLLIIPLSLIGVNSVPNTEVRSWTLVCLILSLTALIPFFGFIVMSYRWSLLLDIPLCIFAAAGLTRLARLRVNLGRWNLPGRKIAAALSMVMIVLSALYLALPAQSAMPYYTVFPGLIPTSMLQGTVPLSDMNNLREVIGWVAANIAPNTALITHVAIYGWAREYLPLQFSINRVFDYGFSSPLAGVEMARSAGYTVVYMIWWINGLGWYGQQYVPNGFSLLVRNGNFAVYEYA
jgi:hypothetical protein